MGPGRIGHGRWGMRVLKGMEETVENYVKMRALSFDRNRNRAKERKPRKKRMGASNAIACENIRFFSLFAAGMFSQASNARQGRREIWAP